MLYFFTGRKTLATSDFFGYQQRAHSSIAIVLKFRSHIRNPHALVTMYIVPAIPRTQSCASVKQTAMHT